MKIKNWHSFQHYKHRDPPWIKLHKRLLDDPEWFALDGDASKMLANCWLLASEHDGALPTIKVIAFRLRMTEEQALKQISKLDHWLERDASEMLAPCLRDADTETETETETEKSIRASRVNKFDPLFLEFYSAYPKKKSKKDAAKAYTQARREVSHETIMDGLARVKPSWRDPQFIPYPASWLRDGGYEDETNVVPIGRPSNIPNIL